MSVWAPPLDFCVVGGQKCGTTTLFGHLSGHPELILPPSKEAPFFHQPVESTKDWRNHAEAHFGSRLSENGLVGTVTPQYLCGPGAADRLAKGFPDLRVVAILRDPIARAHSHYRMSVRRGTEDRAFEEAVDDLLEPRALARSRSYASGLDVESDCYVVWGEYGRLLSEYYEVFHPEQILVLYTEDLAGDPEGVLVRLLQHLSVDDAYRPDDLNARLHSGGSGLPYRLERLLSSRLLKPIKIMVPVRYRHALRVRLMTLGGDRTGNGKVESPPYETVERLREHYFPDVERLEELTREDVPWLWFPS